jgi:hypothetical protein
MLRPRDGARNGPNIRHVTPILRHRKSRRLQNGVVDERLLFRQVRLRSPSRMYWSASFTRQRGCAVRNPNRTSASRRTRWQLVGHAPAFASAIIAWWNHRLRTRIARVTKVIVVCRTAVFTLPHRALPEE